MYMMYMKIHVSSTLAKLVVREESKPRPNTPHPNSTNT